MRTCLLSYGAIFIASLLGGGLGSHLVLRLWRNWEVDIKGGPKNDQDGQ